VLFAASGLARKGAYEIREAARHLSIDLHVLGRAQDSAAFWQGIDIKMVEPGADALDGIDCVVLPAFVEHQPRLLLRAIARGIPVICGPACGLAGYAGVTLIDAGNPAALTAAITASRLGSVTLRKSAE
jgi:glycosyltransferase involved in cell wall biosynthesis